MDPLEITVTEPWCTIPEGWDSFFSHSLVRAELDKIGRTLLEQKKVWPASHQIFRAFQECPEDSLRCILLGQDPYPTPGVAVGMSFAVAPGRPIPASLKNIFTKLRQEGFEVKSTDLSLWARQGVLLLNTAFTVEEGKAGSHIPLWAGFTHLLGQYLSLKEKIVWILWGDKAQKYRGYAHPHAKVIEGGHPSPLNRTGSFQAFNYFGPANQYLISVGKTPISWSLR